MKQLKDYINYYIGGYFMYNDNRLCLCGYNSDTGMVSNMIGQETVHVSKIKLILRPISNMTEEEMKELFFVVFNKKFTGRIFHFYKSLNGEHFSLWHDNYDDRLFIHKDGNVITNTTFHQPTITHWFLSKGFDLFGLIKSGLAITETENTK